MKLLFDKLVTHAQDFTYETVLYLDREMRTDVKFVPLLDTAIPLSN